MKLQGLSSAWLALALAALGLVPCAVEAFASTRRDATPPSPPTPLPPADPKPDKAPEEASSLLGGSKAPPRQRCITANWGLAKGDTLCTSGISQCAGDRGDGRREICIVGPSPKGCGAKENGRGYDEKPAPGRNGGDCSHCGMDMNVCYGAAGKMCCRWGMDPHSPDRVTSNGDRAAIDEENAPYWS